MPAIVIIPSRYHSTRFPGKALYPLLGKPVIQHVFERTRRAQLVKDVFVATDSELIATTVERFGGKAIMTSEAHQSGTDRIAEAVLRIQESGCTIGEGDIIVNVQGDEPLIMPEMVDDLVRLMDDRRASWGTLAKRIREREEITDPNVVKVVFDSEGFALYFSRSPIPFHREVFIDTGYRINESDLERVTMFKHIGIYAYRGDALERFSQLTPSTLEGAEKLEQLRALEGGIRIKVRETSYETIGVDTPGDLERVKKWLSTYSSLAE